jgi:hypothetical protein
MIMRKKVKGRIACMIVSFSVLASFIAIYLTREPSFKGRSFSSWLDQYYANSVTDPGPITSRKLDEARVAILEIGTNAIPCLLRKVRKQDSSFSQRLLVMARKRFGPLLLDQFERRSADHSHTMAGWGFTVLRSAGQPAVPSLIRLLKENNPDVRACAAHCLGAVGPDSRAAIPHLLPLLDERNNGKVIHESMQALGNIHEQPKIVVPALLEFLNGARKEWNYSHAAMQALRCYGAQATTAIPAIEAYLDDPDKQKQEEAFNTLGGIDLQAVKRANDHLRAARAKSLF